MNFQLPVVVHATSNGSVELLLLALFLLVFFHGEDIVEKPLENDSVTVDWDVNLVVIWDLFQAAIEILHIFYQQTPRKCEIPFLVLTVVDNVDHDGVFELEVLPFKHLESLDSAIVVMTCPSHSLVVGGLNCSCGRTMSTGSVLVFIWLRMTSDSWIQMLVCRILMGGCRWMRKTGNICLGIGAVSDAWSLHCTVCIMWMKVVWIALIRRATRHFKQRIHLLLTA